MGEMIDTSEMVFRKLPAVAAELQRIIQDYAPVHLIPAIKVTVEQQGEIGKLIVTVDRSASPAGTWTRYKYGTADARAQEYGSGPNAETPKAEIDIEPKEAPALVFMGTNAFEGKIIRTQHVSSPGIPPYKGRGYVRKGIQDFKEVFLPSIDPDIRDAINLAIKTSFGQKPK